VRVRPARASDREFLIEAILEAEKSGSDRIPYCAIFSLDEAELRALLASILDEDFTGQELCISGFQIGEVEGKPAGAACGWVEGSGGMSSTLVKANLLQHFLDAERLAAARPHLERLAQLSLEREPGAIQLESIYVRPDQRGLGLTGRILAEQIRVLQAEAPGAEKAQIILMKGNDRALRAYRKLGFAVTRERHSEDPALTAILPGATKILMERTLC